ncbi:MAG: DNA repair protein RadC [archaeon]
MRIRDIPKENRPRERFLQHGSNVLSDAELLAIILQKGTCKENVIDMSNRLLSLHSIEKLSGLSLHELQQIKGIGPAKAMQIKAAFELSRRANSGRVCERVVKSSQDIAPHYIERMKGLKREHLIAVLLDSKNKVIKEHVVSIGTLNASLVHPREVFREAIRNSANAIILIHNHPSGDCEPSSEDIVVADRISDAGVLLNVRVIDNIVIGKDCYKCY